jgi:hypothetical protein
MEEKYSWILFIISIFVFIFQLIGGLMLFDIISEITIFMIISIIIFRFLIWILIILSIIVLVKKPKKLWIPITTLILLLTSCVPIVIFAIGLALTGT